MTGRWNVTKDAMERYMKFGMPGDWTPIEVFLRVNGHLQSDIVEYRFEMTAEIGSYMFRLRGADFRYTSPMEQELTEVAAWAHDGTGVIAVTVIPCGMKMIRGDTVSFHVESR
jgi:hypothetical protein